MKSKLISYLLQALAALFISTPVILPLLFYGAYLFIGNINYNFLPLVYFICSFIIAIISFIKYNYKVFAITFILINTFFSFLLYLVFEISMSA